MFSPITTIIVLMVIYLLITFMAIKYKYSTFITILLVGITYNSIGIYAFAYGDEKTATTCCLSSMVIMTLKKLNSNEK